MHALIQQHDVSDAINFEVSIQTYTFKKCTRHFGIQTNEFLDILEMLQEGKTVKVKLQTLKGTAGKSSSKTFLLFHNFPNITLHYPMQKSKK